jgi:hypothetical protein
MASGAIQFWNDGAKDKKEEAGHKTTVHGKDSSYEFMGKGNVL